MKLLLIVLLLLALGCGQGDRGSPKTEVYFSKGATVVVGISPADIEAMDRVYRWGTLSSWKMYHGGPSDWGLPAALKQIQNLFGQQLGFGGDQEYSGPWWAVDYRYSPAVVSIDVAGRKEGRHVLYNAKKLALFFLPAVGDAKDPGAAGSTKVLGEPGTENKGRSLESADARPK